VAALAGYADIFLRNTLASGRIPQISAILGPCAGGAVYGPALTDFIFMARGTSALFLSGPAAVREATGQELTLEELGGAEAHARRSGVAHFALEGEPATLAAVRRLLSFLPSHQGAPLPVRPTSDDPGRRDPALRTLVPEALAAPWDVRELLHAVADDRDLLEVQEAHAANLVVCFARLDGRPVGMLANQPAVGGGALDAAAAVKGARFVRFCDAFGIPVVTFVDVPGFQPDARLEGGGTVVHGAQLLHAFAEATVPKVTVIVRRATGAGYAVMASKHLGADVNLAYPGAEIAVMPPEGAVEVVARKEILAAGPEPAAQAAVRQRLAAEYRQRFANPYRAAELGFIDEVIRPEDTRPRLIQALAMLRNKRRDPPPKKHSTMPL
jgi:propionyl-CoA carboxylase beta chain